MVPSGRLTDKLHEAVVRLAALRRPLAWGALLWVVVVGLPFILLYPEHGLDRPVVVALACMAPLGMVIAALARQPQLLLGIGLAAQLPIVVACPQLLGPRGSSPLQAITIAVVVLLFVAAAFDVTVSARGNVQRVPLQGRLRRLFRWPRSLRARVGVVLGLLWLIMAWSVGEEAGQDAERLRTARTAAVTLCWLATQSLPLALRSTKTISADQGVLLVLMRAVWVGILLGALVWLQSGIGETV